MDRREFILKSSLFALLAGISLESCVQATGDGEELKKLQAGFDRQKLVHLLRRATLGFSQSDFMALEGLAMNEVIKKLLNKREFISKPLNFEFDSDQLVPIGETWIDAPYRLDVFYEQYRKRSLRAWLSSFASENTCSLRQQMLHFWLNFYAISDVIEHKYEYRHIHYLHQNAFGNFKQITKAITVDPAMLRFLSGFENTSESPNENFARELLELFTLGRGEAKAKGDYGTFTEKDVAEISKVLSGWKDTGWFSRVTGEKIAVTFDPAKHDTTTKHLSASFNHASIENREGAEFMSLIDLIFEKEETAIHFTKRLYRWFCCEEITQSAEQEVILPLARLLRASNYEIQPVLSALLSSDHFYAISHASARIKNPLQYTFDLLNFFPLTLSVDVTKRYTFWAGIFDAMLKMGMELMKPPSVAGWKAYYQAPGYSKLWINAASLQSKRDLVNCITGQDTTWEPLDVKVDFANLVKQSGTKNFEELIAYFNLLFFNGQLDASVSSNAKKVLSECNDARSEHEFLQTMCQGHESALEAFRKMLAYLFNLPMLNLH